MRLIDTDDMEYLEELEYEYHPEPNGEPWYRAKDVWDCIEKEHTVDPASLRPKGEWISVEDRLPEEKEYVMIWCGECQIARIEKGISKEQREAMKRGELDDPCESGWTLSTGYFTLKRSQAYKACDEQGNNRVPYCWYPNGGPMSWFGQNVTHWMPLPKPPNSGADMRGNPNDS